MNKFGVLVLFFLQCVLCEVNRTWWKHTTIYEVYLPSYKDSNGDGFGDLPGLISKLDHIREMGVETIYVTPFYMSPMEDAGYDISNFTAVNPIFGTIDDFDELVAEANKRGLKLIIDVVLNHSSDEHPWFIKSINKTEPYTDFYVWRDPKFDSEGNRIPPNNWFSIFEGSAWEWNEERKQYYLHQFTVQQPDFNLRHKFVKKELKKMLTFWLDRGVAGFRLDATNFLIEDAEFRDEQPVSPDIKVPRSFWEITHNYTLLTQESYEFLHEMRVHCDKVTKKFGDYERIFVPETYASGKHLTQYYGTSDYRIAHFPLNFVFVLITGYQNATFYNRLINDYLNTLPEGATPTWNPLEKLYYRILLPETYSSGKYYTQYYGTSDYKIAHFPLNFVFVLITGYQNATFYNRLINDYLNTLPEGATPTWNSENHDKFRKALLFDENYEYIFTTLVLTLPGVAYVYYGQEIGMTGSRIRDDQRVDKWVDDFTKESRDSARLPMQWDDSLNGGFSNNLKTHLPLSSNYWKINVKKQKNEKNSHYYVFKKLLELRNTEVFKYGAFKSYVISTWVFAFTRTLNGHKTYLVVINLGSETEFVHLSSSISNLPDKMKVEATSPNSGYHQNDDVPTISEKILILRPFTTMILGST